MSRFRRVSDRPVVLIATGLVVSSALGACGRHESIRFGHSQSDGGARLSELTSPREQLALAIRSDDDTTVQRILDAGFDINGRLPNGRTPLLEATVWGRVSLVAKLLQRGADPNLTDNDGKNAFDLAEGQPAIMNLLRPELGEELQRQLFDAIRANQYSKVKEALKAGANPDEWDAEGQTALTLAISLKFENVVRVLLQPGVEIDVNKRNRNGESPLGIARKLGLSRVEKFLLQRGANGG